VNEALDYLLALRLLVAFHVLPWALLHVVVGVDHGDVQLSAYSMCVWRAVRGVDILESDLG